MKQLLKKLFIIIFLSVFAGKSLCNMDDVEGNVDVDAGEVFVDCANLDDLKDGLFIERKTTKALKEFLDSIAIQYQEGSEQEIQHEKLVNSATVLFDQILVELSKKERIRLSDVIDTFLELCSFINTIETTGRSQIRAIKEIVERLNSLIAEKKFLVGGDAYLICQIRDFNGLLETLLSDENLSMTLRGVFWTAINCTIGAAVGLALAGTGAWWFWSKDRNDACSNNIVTPQASNATPEQPKTKPKAKSKSQIKPFESNKNSSSRKTTKKNNSRAFRTGYDLRNIERINYSDSSRRNK